MNAGSTAFRMRYPIESFALRANTDRSVGATTSDNTMPTQTRTPLTALITGSARGIGAEIAKHLASKGVTVAIHYRNSRDDAEEVLAACQQHAPESMLVQGDLTDPAQAARICEEAEETLGGVELLVNNIGNYIRKNVLELSIDEWRDQLESNLYTTFFTCHTLMPLMLQRSYGRIVNIGYAGSQQPFYNFKTVPYHIAKTGVNMLTRNLAALVDGRDVTVNCLGMGVIENSIRQPDEIPAGRTGSFADVCNALDFVISANSRYVNGSQIDVSGGWIPEQILHPKDYRTQNEESKV